MQVSIWLKDGSEYKNATLVSGDIKVDGQLLDTGKLSEIDNAYLYTSDGAQIYRDRVTGNIQISEGGIAGNLTLGIDQIDELERA